MLIDDREIFRRIAEECGFSGHSDNDTLRKLLKENGLEELNYGKIQEVLRAEDKSSKEGS
jgi:hypothetical protein